jgi:hypothetical protein
MSVERMGWTELTVVMDALKRMRVVRVGLLESQLVDLMAEELERSGLAFTREVRLGPGCRIDMTVPVEGSSMAVGIEAKKSRPNAMSAAAQVARYAATGRLTAVVFVAERAFDLPEEMSGIPVRAVSLQASMGIAL